MLGSPNHTTRPTNFGSHLSGTVSCSSPKQKTTVRSKITQVLKHPMTLRRRKRKMKLLSANGSVEHLMDDQGKIAQILWSPDLGSKETSVTLKEGFQK